MYLKQCKSGDLVEVVNIEALLNPSVTAVLGRLHAGEELQDESAYAKQDLMFPSGETLPRCWMDVHYRDA